MPETSGGVHGWQPFQMDSSGKGCLVGVPRPLECILALSIVSIPCGVRDTGPKEWASKILPEVLHGFRKLSSVPVPLAACGRGEE